LNLIFALFSTTILGVRIPQDSFLSAPQTTFQNKLGHAGTILGKSQVSRVGTVPRHISQYSGKTSYHMAWQYEWDCSVFFRCHGYQPDRKTSIIILKATYVFEDLQLLEKIMVDVGTRPPKSIDQVKRVLWVRRTPACMQ
jgi:hypothetical protein